MSDENVEIFLETFLQFHPANRSLAALALPAWQRCGRRPGGPRLWPLRLTGAGARAGGGTAVGQAPVVPWSLSGRGYQWTDKRPLGLIVPIFREEVGKSGIAQF
ncbi:MAG: hypothetical protein PHS80_05570 [Methanothrix sp.]|nr:hypothetical protein [Methanothrix sp.]MDD4447449.1 hypothetical protein [Methanothrix sp.]